MKSIAVGVEIHLTRTCSLRQSGKVSASLDCLPLWQRLLFRCVLWVTSWTCTGWIATLSSSGEPPFWKSREFGPTSTDGRVITDAEMIRASEDGNGCSVKPNKGR